MDINLAQMSGLECVAQLKAKMPEQVFPFHA